MQGTKSEALVQAYEPVPTSWIRGHKTMTGFWPRMDIRPYFGPQDVINLNSLNKDDPKLLETFERVVLLLVNTTVTLGRCDSRGKQAIQTSLSAL